MPQACAHRSLTAGRVAENSAPIPKCLTTTMAPGTAWRTSAAMYSEAHRTESALRTLPRAAKARSNERGLASGIQHLVFCANMIRFPENEPMTLLSASAITAVASFRSFLDKGTAGRSRRWRPDSTNIALGSAWANRGRSASRTVRPPPDLAVRASTISVTLREPKWATCDGRTQPDTARRSLGWAPGIRFGTSLIDCP